MTDSNKPATGGATVFAGSGAGPGSAAVASPPPTPTGAPPAGGATMIASSSAELGAPVEAAADHSVPVAVSGSDDPLVGKVLTDRYLIRKRLGEGGMGTVYLAEHTTIKKKVAIKVLSTEFSHKKDLVDRFLQEARAASMIDQENVVEITDYGSTPDGSVYFVMEFLPGEDLSHTVKREGALPWARVKPIMLQICRALQAAHDAGIIHRDMKPENCFRIKRGSNPDFIKVLDFGIAKVTGDENEGGKGLTRTGMIFGTPEYMSPEQAKGERPDHRVDVYAVGVILYELITGKVPFHADTFMGILTKHMFETPEAPSAVAPPSASIPPEVEAIVLKAMQKNREHRFQSMNEFAAAIEAVGSGSAMVVVVDEQIERPSDGETQFRNTVIAGGAGTYPPAAAIGYGATTAVDIPQRSNTMMILGVAFGLLLVGGGAAFFAFGGAKPAEPAPIAAAVEPAAPVADAKPPADVKAEPAVDADAPPAVPPPVKQIEKTTPTVTFKITTPGVDAEILDAKDMGSFGKTNDPDGVKVPKSEEELALIIRADGYEDLAKSITPNLDKTFEFKLVKKEVKKKPTSGGGKKPTTDTTPPPPTPPKKTDPPERQPPSRRSSSPDLKDPFAK
jgi:serine/threonine-protein kinase